MNNLHFYITNAVITVFTTTAICVAADLVTRLSAESGPAGRHFLTLMTGF